MPKANLIWGLCADQLCVGHSALQPLCGSCSCVGNAWNPPCCLRISCADANVGICTADALPFDAVQVSSGWTYTVAVSLHAVAYVVDTSELRQLGRHRHLDLSRSESHQQQHDQQQQQAPHGQNSTLWQQVHTPLPARTLVPPPPQAAVHIAQVSCGDQHCLLLDQHGRVWAFGSNTHGQLGTPAGHSNLDTPPAAKTASQQQMQGNAQHTSSAPPAVAAADEATAEHQQMQQPYNAPAAVQAVLVLGPGSDHSCQEQVMQVAAGACHSLAVTRPSGRLYTWGWSAHGQCGTGSTSDIQQPALCGALDGVPLAAAAAGMAHSVVASRDGAVYSFGWNSNSQLGLVSRHQQDHSQSSLLPRLVEDPQLDVEHVVKVACGSRHSVVLSASGRVYTWGFNKYGQCCTTVLQEAAATGPALSDLTPQWQQATVWATSMGAEKRQDVVAPHGVQLPQSVEVPSQHSNPSCPSSLAAAELTRDMTRVADVVTSFRVGKVLSIQAGGWHTLIEIEVQPLAAADLQPQQQ